MSSTESTRFQSVSDYDTSFCMYAGMLQSLNSSTIGAQSDSISPENLLLLMKNRTKSIRYIPAELQIELSLLWRTLGILRYSVGTHGVMQSFYEGLLGTITEVDSLALSNFNNSSASHEDSGCKPEGGLKSGYSMKFQPTCSSVRLSSASGRPSPQIILPVPELAYLKEGSEFDGDDENDPLGVVQKLFDSSVNFASGLPYSVRGAMYSVCVALAVKSGRLSLLLKAVSLLISEEGSAKKVDFLYSSCNALSSEIITDIVQYLSSGLESKNLSISTALKVVRLHQISSYSVLPSSVPLIRDKSDNISTLYRGCKDYSDVLQFHQNRRSVQNQSSNYNQNEGQSTSRVTLSFGKADHGKLGLGDSQVQILQFLVLHQDLSKLSSYLVGSDCSMGSINFH